MPSCGEAVVRLLERRGADTVFGIPGVHTLEIYRGLIASPLRTVGPRHEQGAAFMADGWARVSGEPGICVLISGPGLTNAVTAVAQAYHDSVPLLIISGVVAERERGRGEIHDLPDQQGLMATVTAFSHVVSDPAELPEVMARAYAVFDSARPRPVHIAIPTDVMTEPAGALDLTARPSPARPLPTTEQVARAAQQLAAAERPLVLLGGGAHDAGAEAISVAEALGAPVGLTINARGTVPDGHPLCLGSALSFPPISDLIRAADATLLVGAELSDLDLWGLDHPLELPGLVRVDIDAGQLTNRWTPVIGLHGDAAGTLAMLERALAELPRPAPATPAPGASAPPPRMAAAAQRVAAARAALRAPHELTRFAPLLAILDRALPADRIVVGDSTQPVYAANHLLPAHTPRSWLMPIGYGCLGGALPMAIGAKLAAPERPVVAITGDGGFLFTVQELITARELGMTLPVLVYNNGGYGEIREAMDHASMHRLGTEFRYDCTSIARGLGCRATCVTTLDQLEAALTAALTAPEPTVIELLVPVANAGDPIAW